MIDPRDWSKDHLLTLVETKTTEGLTLEYKASAALANTEKSKNELARDVSSLANSAGGVIVYGVVEREHFPASLDDGVDPAVISREWLDQVIASRIHPRIDGVYIKDIPFEGQVPGRVGYLVNVPQSTTAHMSADHRYYKRLNTTIAAMEDYEVRDVMGRNTAPKLRLSLSSSRSPGDSTALDIVLALENDSIAPAEYCVVQIFFSRALIIVADGGAHGVEPVAADDGTRLTALRFQYGGVNQLPIWQGLRVNLAPRPLCIKAEQAGNYIIGWRVTAPRMGWQTGNVSVAFPSGAGTSGPTGGVGT